MRKILILLSLLFAAPAQAADDYRLVGWSASAFDGLKAYYPHYNLNSVKVLVDRNCKEIHYCYDDTYSFPIGDSGQLYRQVLHRKVWQDGVQGDRIYHLSQFGTFQVRPVFVNGQMVNKLVWDRDGGDVSYSDFSPYPDPECHDPTVVKLLTDPPFWLDSWFYGPADPYEPLNNYVW